MVFDFKLEEARELIAGGINPYHPEENIGVTDDEYFRLIGRVVSPTLDKKTSITEKKGVIGYMVEEKEGIRYKINGYDDAQRIHNNFDWSEEYLRNLVSRVTGDGGYADSLGYTGLRKEGHKIRGVVFKILGLRWVH